MLVSIDAALPAVFDGSRVVDAAGDVWCKGSCPMGGTALTNTAVWTKVPGLSDAKALAPKNCVIGNADQVLCWGNFKGPKGMSLYTTPVAAGSAPAFANWSVKYTDGASIDAFVTAALAKSPLGQQVLSYWRSGTTYAGFVSFAEDEAGALHVWSGPVP